MSEQQANKLTKKELLGALAAGAASVYLQTDAEAGIQYTDSTANPVTSDATTTGDTFWDIDGDGSIDEAVIKNVADSKSFAGLQGRFSFAATQNGFLRALSSGQTVGTGRNFDNRAELLFYSALRLSTVGFSSGVENYFGFKLSASGSTYYGWAKTTLTNGNISSIYGTMTISEWAYNDVAGASITVGDTGNSAVPEPSSFAITGLGLLAAGAGGVRRWRREKKDKAS